MNKPYVVSADIYLLMKKWADQRGFVLPSKKFFCQLREEFSVYMRQIFPGFELVTEDEISLGLARLVDESGLTAISLDRVYFHSNLNLEITRLVDNKGNDLGRSHRAGSLPLPQQLQEIQKSGVQQIVLVDDVIFTGNLIKKAIDLLYGIGIRVSLVCAGIGISNGINDINNIGCEVRCVRIYQEVIDEVCERDFYPGVPLSGRLLAGDSNIGIPYILPFGDPEKWASIPSEKTVAFSKFCLYQTIKLFDAIERHSCKPVRCLDLGRMIVGLPTDKTRYTNVLRKIL